MYTRELIAKEVKALYQDGVDLVQAFQKEDKKQNFPYEYQSWYTKALKVVEILAPDRYQEFRAYYEVDPKRKSLGYGTYVIQDFLNCVSPASYLYENFDTREQTLKNTFNSTNHSKAHLLPLQLTLWCTLLPLTIY